MNKQSEIIDYTIIAEDSILDLIKKVRKYCESGWQPQGGIFESSISKMYMQAIVIKINSYETAHS